MCIGVLHTYVVQMKNTYSYDVFQLTSSLEIAKQEVAHGKSTNGNQLSERPKIAIGDYTQTESNEFAYLSGRDFKLIFGDKNANYGSKQTVVKITNAQTGKSIHRLYRTSHDIHGLSNYIVLTYSSLLHLCKDQDTFDRMDKLIVSKGSIMKFYLNHPNHCTKIMLWMALLSIVLSAISIAFSCLFV